jgi:P-type conjugative transfer protein TrbG
MRYKLIVAMLVLPVAGCTAKQSPHVQASAPIVATAHISAAPEGPSAVDILTAQPSLVRAAIRSHALGNRWPTFRNGGTVLYPFDTGVQPTIDCAPLRTTDVQFENGETITDIAIGDQDRWMATPASSGDPRDPTPHLALKPQVAGIETNLTVYTTRHIYHLVARASGHALEEVEFYYPDEILAEMADADHNREQSRQEAAAVAHPAQLNFSYQITGTDVRWKPARVWDDGSHVYVEMPDAMKASEAPALMIESAGGMQMVNYRLVNGNTFVADLLFDRAVLVAGVGREQDRVTIAYTGVTR